MPKLIRKGELGLNTTNLYSARSLTKRRNHKYLELFANANTIIPVDLPTSIEQPQLSQNDWNQQQLWQMQRQQTQGLHNDLDVDINLPQYSDRFKSSIPDYSQQYEKKTQSTMNNMKLKASAGMQQSSNKGTQLLGKEQMDNTVESVSGDADGSTIEESFEDKYNNSFFGKNQKAINEGLDFVGDTITSFDKKAYVGPKGDLKKGITDAWNGVSDVVSKFGPYGQVAGMAMKAANALNSVQNLALGSKALDNMTTTDAILSSPLGMLVPGLGLVNALGGQAANTITKNEDAFAQIGSAYGGSNAMVDSALDFSGKRYGLFSSGARKDANALIAESRRQQNMIEDISDEATIRKNLASSMSAINSNRRALTMQGGYNQSAIHFGRNGFSFKTIAKTKKVFDLLNHPKIDSIQTNELKEIFLPSEIQEVKLPEFKLGGIIEKSLDDIPVERTVSEIKLEQLISEFKEGGTIESKEPENKEPQEYTPEDPESIIKFVNKHKKVNFVQRLRDSFRETIPDWEVEGNVATHKLGYAEDRDKIKVFPLIQEIDGELHDFTNPEYKHGKWDALESAEKNGDVIIFDNKDDAEWFTKHYKEYYPTFNKYKEGGKFNVIPEGALHARLHHMEDDENITKKGIPVVSEDENGNIEQQAEIEQNELIIRLSVTELLENLQKKFYNDNYSQEEKDNFAIQAGKTLVYEILYNTQDNTGLINNIEKD